MSRIVANGIVAGGVSDADRRYMADLVSARAGIPQPEARTRVDDLVASTADAQVRIKAAGRLCQKGGVADGPLYGPVDVGGSVHRERGCSARRAAAR